MQLLLNKLKNWFLSSKRDLPWRENPTPYAVWISEVMLQQTQVAVVKPYFERWMKLFPTITHLAEAPLEKVIKAWEGLGYYSRARNLHEGAQFILSNYQGQLPEKEEELDKIKGLGPYTIGAIRSFAFHQKAAAVDGNVLRVISRLLKITQPIDQPSTQKEIKKWVEHNLPNKEPWIIMEGLIELGATICTKKPTCEACPLISHCLAYRDGMTSEIPIKAKKTSIEKLYRTVAVIQCQNSFLLQKVDKGKIMSDLHEFPYFETAVRGLSKTKLIDCIYERYGLKTFFERDYPEVQHGFTRYQVRLKPFLLSAKEKLFIPSFQWHSAEEINDLAFSSGHRKILSSLIFS